MFVKSGVVSTSLSTYVGSRSNVGYPYRCKKFLVRPVKGEAILILRITLIPGLGSGSNTNNSKPKSIGTDPLKVRNLI